MEESDRRGMTFRVTRLHEQDGRVFALFGADERTDPYRGDTSVREELGLLALRSGYAPRPSGLPLPHRTPGGAIRGGWSGAVASVVPSVLGARLVSLEVADALCHEAFAGSHMARFNEVGGWDFWADVTDVPRADLEGRLWVAILDQRANPWDGAVGPETPSPGTKTPRAASASDDEDDDDEDDDDEDDDDEDDDDEDDDDEDDDDEDDDDGEPESGAARLGVNRARALALTLLREGRLQLGDGVERIAQLFAEVRLAPADTLAHRLGRSLEGRAVAALTASVDDLEVALDRTSPWERVPVTVTGEAQSFATLEVPWRLSGPAETSRVERHPDGRAVALRLPVTTGTGWASAIWDAPTGRLLALFDGAVDIRFTGDGTEVFVLYPLRLSRFAWPELRAEGSTPAGASPSAYADRLAVEPRGDAPAIAVLSVAPAEGLWSADLVRDGVTSSLGALGRTPPADPIFSPDGSTLVTAVANRAWWREQRDDGTCDCGSLVMMRLREGSTTFRAVHVDVPAGYVPPDPARAERLGPVTFTDDHTLALVTPLGERRTHDWVELVGPARPPLPAPADVFAYVGPARGSTSDGPAPPPGDHGLRRWLVRGEELLVYRAGSLERRRATDGSVLCRAHLPEVPGYPVDVAVSPDGTVVALSWCNPELGCAGYHVVDPREGRVLHGRGFRRDADGPGASRFVLRGPVWAPGGRILISSWGVAGWWLDPATGGVATSGFKVMGEVVLHDVASDRASSEMVMQSLPEGWTLDPAGDPDAISAAEIQGDTELAVVAPTGERVPLSLAELAPAGDRGRPLRRSRTARPSPPAAPKDSTGERLAAPTRRVRAVTAAGEALADVEAPLDADAGDTVTATGIAMPPAEDLVAMRLEGAGGAHAAGVWDLRSGALVHAFPDAIAFWFGERGDDGPRGNGIDTNLELAVLHRDQLVTRFWPSLDERASLPIDAPGAPVRLAVARFDPGAEGVRRGLVRFASRFAVAWEHRDDFRAGVIVYGDEGPEPLIAHETNLRDPTIVACAFTPDAELFYAVFRERAGGKGPSGELLVYDVARHGAYAQALPPLPRGASLSDVWLAGERSLLIGGLAAAIELERSDAGD